LQMPDRIHIFGASGSGTSSLASALAARHGHRHLDTDDFYWFPTDPPYEHARPREVRLALLASALAQSPSWVLSGSLCGWGDPLIPEFDLVVFLVVPTPVRLTRLRAREAVRYGHQAIAQGGELHDAHVAFLDWAGRYDAGGADMRSRALHEAWLSTLPGAVLRLEGNRRVVEQLTQIESSLEAGRLT
jgi:adenylate kinase family enzyme